MKILAQENDVYLFSIRKNEETPIKKISELFQCDFTYIGIMDENDLRANGHKDLVDRYTDSIDFRKVNIIIAKREQPEPCLQKPIDK